MSCFDGNLRFYQSNESYLCKTKMNCEKSSACEVGARWPLFLHTLRHTLWNLRANHVKPPKSQSSNEWTKIKSIQTKSNHHQHEIINQSINQSIDRSINQSNQIKSLKRNIIWYNNTEFDTKYHMIWCDMTWYNMI